MRRGSCPGEHGPFPADWWSPSRCSTTWEGEPGPLSPVSLEVIVRSSQLVGIKVKNKDFGSHDEGTIVLGSLKPAWTSRMPTELNIPFTHSFNHSFITNLLTCHIFNQDLPGARGGSRTTHT